MLGIGAAHQKDPSGIAWKQNKDFENLLKRLNETPVAGNAELDIAENEPEVHYEENDCKTKDKLKRKKDREGAPEKKARKKIKRSTDDEQLNEVGGETAKSTNEFTEVEGPPSKMPKPYLPRHRA